MAKEKPQTSNQIKDSEVRVGGNMQQAHTIYNNYFQGQTVEIPRRLTLNIPANADHILGREDELNTTSQPKRCLFSSLNCLKIRKIHLTA